VDEEHRLEPAAVHLADEVEEAGFIGVRRERVHYHHLRAESVGLAEDVHRRLLLDELPAERVLRHESDDEDRG
jgi:hypothetical protein